MKLKSLPALILPALLCACAAGVDVAPLLQEFDEYDGDLQTVSADDQTLTILEQGRRKRVEADSLFTAGKKEDAVLVARRALADARLAREVEAMNAAARRAEKCLVQVEQSRTKWREAIFILEQTEEFVGSTSPVSRINPAPTEEEPKLLPETTLSPAAFPPATLDTVSGQWKTWRQAAGEQMIVAADLETEFGRSQTAAQGEKVDAATAAHYRYVAARDVQMLECRVRAANSERVCVEATELMSAFGDARAEILAATLDLERGLKNSLRRELEDLRAEAKTRQDELYDALSQMEGRFASIRRDARGTIVSLADILFDFDKATLRREVEFNLVKIATILNQFAEMGIVIEGHTDSIGPEEYNLGLSQRRAQAVFDFLISQGVDESRLSWEGYGETQPVADNDTDEGRQMNRRVDLVIQDAP